MPVLGRRQLDSRLCFRTRPVVLYRATVVYGDLASQRHTAARGGRAACPGSSGHSSLMLHRTQQAVVSRVACGTWDHSSELLMLGYVKIHWSALRFGWTLRPCMSPSRRALVIWKMLILSYTDLPDADVFHYAAYKPTLLSILSDPVLVSGIHGGDWDFLTVPWKLK